MCQITLNFGMRQKWTCYFKPQLELSKATAIVFFGASHEPVRDSRIDQDITVLQCRMDREEFVERHEQDRLLRTCTTTGGGQLVGQLAGAGRVKCAGEKLLHPGEAGDETVGQALHIVAAFMPHGG